MSETITEQYAACIIELESALESQKAITELAVKALEWYADIDNHTWHEDEEDVFKAPWTSVLNDCGSKAKLAISEIRRLIDARQR